MNLRPLAGMPGLVSLPLLLACWSAAPLAAQTPEGPFRDAGAFPGPYSAAVVSAIPTTVSGAVARGAFRAERHPPLPLGLTLQEEPGDRRVVQVFIASLLGSYAGWIGGAWGGAVIAAQSDYGFYDEEFFVGFIAGSVIGSSLGAALGGNLADGPEGTFGERLLVAGIVGLTGTLLAVAAESQALWFSVPLMETIAMVAKDYR